MIQVFYLLNCRSLHRTAFAIGLFTNRWVIAGSLGMVAAQLLFTYAPVLNQIFHSAPISRWSWLRVLGVAAVAFVAVEIEKWLRFGGHPTQPPNQAAPSIGLSHTRTP